MQIPPHGSKVSSGPPYDLSGIRTPVRLMACSTPSGTTLGKTRGALNIWSTGRKLPLIRTRSCSGYIDLRWCITIRGSPSHQANVTLSEHWLALPGTCTSSSSSAAQDTSSLLGVSLFCRVHPSCHGTGKPPRPRKLPLNPGGVMQRAHRACLVCHWPAGSGRAAGLDCSV